jgi:DNA-binding transcriptional ArsR family regulator
MATKTQRPSATQNRLVAMSHPLRARVLGVLSERTASPKEIADQLGEPIPNVSHHAKRLVQLGCAELVDKRQVRGAIEHFYRATPRSFIGHQDWRRAPRSVRGGVTDAAVGSFVEATAAAAEAGTIDSRDDTTLNWMPMAVDETGWSEIAAIMETARKQLTEVHERSSKRLSGGAGIAVIVGLAGFEAGRPAGKR